MTPDTTPNDESDRPVSSSPDPVGALGDPGEAATDASVDAADVPASEPGSDAPASGVPGSAARAGEGAGADVDPTAASGTAVPAAAGVPAAAATPAATPTRAGTAARRSSRSRSRSGRAARRRQAIRETVLMIALALVISVLLRTFVVQAFYIPSESMQDTLQIGDRILVSKLEYRFGEPHRGDVVVFRGPPGWQSEVLYEEPTGVGGALRDVATFVGLLPSQNEQDFVKRVIGVAGDRVQCCDAKGRLMVNGVPIEEPYVIPGDPPSEIPFDVTVPAGKLWVMGDHRSNSADSRYHRSAPDEGFVPVDEVIGRGFVIVWPSDRWGGIGRPGTFDSVPAAAGR